MPIQFRDNLDPDYVKSALRYNPETGVMSWNFRTDMSAAWNGRNAGKPAGTKTQNGYVAISINNKLYLSHRLAWVIMTGGWPRQEIDHVNRDRSDAKWSNLREASRIENSRNVASTSRSKSGYKGVSYDKGMKSWVARIKIGSRYVVLGYRGDPETASSLYAAAAMANHGPFIPYQGIK